MGGVFSARSDIATTRESESGQPPSGTGSEKCRRLPVREGPCSDGTTCARGDILVWGIYCAVRPDQGSRCRYAVRGVSGFRFGACWVMVRRHRLACRRCWQYIRRKARRGEGIRIGEVLQDGDGGADLTLGRMSHTTVKSTLCALFRREL